MNDPRWKIVDELNARASRLADAATKAWRLGLMTEDEAFAAIEESHRILGSADELTSQIIADGTAAQRVADPTRWG